MQEKFLVLCGMCRYVPLQLEKNITEFTSALIVFIFT